MYELSSSGLLQKLAMFHKFLTQSHYFYRDLLTVVLYLCVISK